MKTNKEYQRILNNLRTEYKVQRNYNFYESKNLTIIDN